MDGSLILALGGIFGLLPDTIDFRFTRFLTRVDEEVDPQPGDFQPQAVADRIASTMRLAFETSEPKTILLHTSRLGPDLWRAYSVRFSPATGEVVVRVGPIVNTSAAPLPGSEPTGNLEGRASVGVPMVRTFDAETDINSFSGPAFRFERQRSDSSAAPQKGAQDDAVHAIFLPWHRRWSHSITLSVVVGVGMGLLLGPMAGLISGLGFATHIFQDQLGHMGSNLLWPVQKRRTKGLGLLHSGDAVPNFLTVWLAVALTYFNLDRFSATPRLPALPYLSMVVVLPALVMGTLYVFRRRREKRRSVEALRQEEIADETKEIEL
jgi:hypothetical protein